MTLDPAFAGMLEHINHLPGAGRAFTGSPSEWRRAVSDAIEGGRDLAQFEGLAQSEDVDLGTASIRIYRPANPQSRATLVYFHPGGFAAGSVWLSEDVALRLVKETGACVVSVDYRLAPEHPFPAPLDDAITAIEWVFEHVLALGGLSDQIALVGESSGANLAASATLEVQKRGLRPAALLLVTPYTDMSSTFPSQRALGRGFFLTDVDLRDIREMYLGGNTAETEPKVSPALSPDLDRFPPTIVAVAGHDPLRDDGIVFAGRLLMAGVDASLRTYPSLIHPFFGMSQVTPVADAAMVELCADLISVLPPHVTEE
jgi:acetyl esterase